MLHNPVGCLALDMREVKEVSVHSLSVYLSHKGNEAFCFFCLNAGCRNLICAGVLTSTLSLNSGCAILEKWWFWKFEAELWWFILGFSCFWGCWPNLFPWSCNLWLNTHTRGRYFLGGFTHFNSVLFDLTSIFSGKNSCSIIKHPLTHTNCTFQHIF